MDGFDLLNTGDDGNQPTIAAKKWFAIPQHVAVLNAPIPLKDEYIHVLADLLFAGRYRAAAFLFIKFVENEIPIDVSIAVNIDTIIRIKKGWLGLLVDCLDSNFMTNKNHRIITHLIEAFLYLGADPYEEYCNFNTTTTVYDVWSKINKNGPRWWRRKFIWKTHISSAVIKTEPMVDYPFNPDLDRLMTLKVCNNDWTVIKKSLLECIV